MHLLLADETNDKSTISSQTKLHENENGCKYIAFIEISMKGRPTITRRSSHSSLLVFPQTKEEAIILAHFYILHHI